MSIILNAARLAARYHREQKRNNNGYPYMTHLIRVAGRVMTLDDMNEADAAAAFLHDGPEDQVKAPGDLEQMHREIEQACGVETLVIVIALTNPSKGSTASRAERKQIDREHLSRCPVRVKRIKLVDRNDNLQESIRDILIGHDTNFKFNRLYADESQLLLDESLIGADPLLEAELAESIKQLHAACDLKQPA
jgi:(p)ppGpp synthase/HD superfamily hydrolase